MRCQGPLIVAGMGTGGMSIEGIGLEAMGIEGRIDMEGRGSSSARALWSPSDHTGGHTGCPMATHPWLSRHLHASMSNPYRQLPPSLLPRHIGTIARTPKPTTPMSNSAQGDGGR